MLVVDASLVVELALDRIGEQASADLDRGGELIAPPLLWSEVPSVLHEISFRGEITDALAELAFQRFLSGRLSIKERRPEGLAASAWGLAAKPSASRRAPQGNSWTKRWREGKAIPRAYGCTSSPSWSSPRTHRSFFGEGDRKRRDGD